MAPNSLAILANLQEIRYRGIIILATFISAFITCFCYSDYLITWVLSPFHLSLPNSSPLIVTDITNLVVIPVSLSALSALVITMPMLIWQVWRFIAPGLYNQERQLFFSIVALSILLFVLGCGFCLFTVMSLIIRLLVSLTPSSMLLMPDMGYSVNFILYMSLLFGVCFQVPIACILLIKANMTTLATLQKARPYIIVAAFIIGMLLTPPDVLSQLLLAIPIWLLYELSLIVIKMGRYLGA